MQVFQTNRLVLTNEPGRYLMLKIPARIGYTSMELGDFLAGFLAILAALLFPGVLALGLGQFLLIACIVFGIGYRLPITGDEEGFETQVNAHSFPSQSKRCDFFLNQ